MRDDEWLISRFFSIWNNYFSDVAKQNKIVVKFKGKWKNKFGHIKMKDGVTEIAINGLFKSLEIPCEIIDLTIAHEIVHYVHGFQSPLSRRYRHPHAGGVVSKELKRRGLGENLIREKRFVKDWWQLYSDLTGEKLISSKREPRIVVRYFR